MKDVNLYKECGLQKEIVCFKSFFSFGGFDSILLIIKFVVLCQLKIDLKSVTEEICGTSEKSPIIVLAY